MVRKLRSGAKLGLLYGQGGFVTKHRALVLSRQAPRTPLAQETSVQSEADRHRGQVPNFVTEANGRGTVKGTVESFTAIYGRNNEIEHGVVMLRTPENARALTRVPANDCQTLAHLLDMDRTPVGSAGEIVTAKDGVLEWRVG
jgi:acetyl-CoA C-acetyltransferase